MRSFVTICIAAALALLTFLMLPASASTDSQYYALKITLEENGEVFDTPQIVVEQGKSYSVKLKAGGQYDFNIEIPADTHRAVKAQFDRDLGKWADDFMVVNTEISFRERPEARNLPEYGKAVTSNLLLRKDGRAIRSDIPVQDRGLVTQDGAAIQALAITIEAVPFR